MKFNQKIAKHLSGIGLSAALVLAGAGTVSYYEGVSNEAYLDPVGIWTICYGETEGVAKGDYKTDEECLDSLAEELTEHHKKMVLYIKTPISVKEEAAYLSFTYNVGVNNFKSSTLLKKLNSGDRAAACNELSKWVYAKGFKLPGLIKRREKEKEMCLDGAASRDQSPL